jgi:hypothetical protein
MGSLPVRAPARITLVWIIWIYGLPWALALPLNSPDIGTSRWQLVIERYTNFPCIRKGPKCPLVAHLLGFIGLGPPNARTSVPDLGHGNGYSGEGIDRPRRCVTSHQYSPAVISPASGNTGVSGSAAHRTKNTKKLSVGGLESGPLLFHCSQVNGRKESAQGNRVK